MLGINSNINSLVAQQNLTSSGSALSQAITRLSSGKRINSAADDAAGLAISNIMQTQINGLNQGVSNANDGVSMVQTASSGLSSLTNSLQRIRQLATQASNGSMTDSDRQALQQEVSQQVQEINRIASQTTYNGMNVLNGSLGSVSFQVGANVGQTINLNLSQNVSAASLGGGAVQAGNVLGAVSVSLDSSGAQWSSTSTGNEITQINVLSDGKGGFTFTDQNNQSLPSSFDTTTIFDTTTTPGSISVKTGSALDPAKELAAINANNTLTAAAGSVLGTIGGIAIDPSTGADVTATNGALPAGTVTSITAKSDGSGNIQLFDQNGTALSASATSALFTTTAATSSTAGSLAFKTAPTSNLNVNESGTTQTVSNVNISTQAGANQAIESIDNALSTVNNIQATLGAAQNRFTAISTTQQAQSTDLSQAQSSIQDANFAAETANLSKAQVLQQAGISVLAQANSQPQQILKLLQ